MLPSRDLIRDGKLAGRDNVRRYQMLGDVEYFKKRLAQEVALAVASDTEPVRAVHRQLSQLYAERLAALGAADDVLPAFQQPAPIADFLGVAR